MAQWTAAEQSHRTMSAELRNSHRTAEQSHIIMSLLQELGTLGYEPAKLTTVAVSAAMQEALQGAVDGASTKFRQWLQTISEFCVAPYRQGQRNAWDGRILTNRVLLLQSLSKIFKEQLCQQNNPQVADLLHTLVCDAAACSRQPIVLKRLVPPSNTSTELLEAVNHHLKKLESRTDCLFDNRVGSFFHLPPPNRNINPAAYLPIFVSGLMWELFSMYVLLPSLNSVGWQEGVVVCELPDVARRRSSIHSELTSLGYWGTAEEPCRDPRVPPGNPATEVAAKEGEHAPTSSLVPGRMPALFRSVGGVLSDYFRHWFTRIVYTGHKG
jgi:hypothetical protein